jgi:O-antigen ligase
MDREVLDRWCERGILGSVLALLIFTPLAFGGRGQDPAHVWFDFIILNPFLVPQLMAVLVLVLWIVRLWLIPRPRLLWPPICWAVAAFTLYVMARYLTSPIEYVARQEFIMILVYAILFYAVICNLHRQESIQIITFSLLALAMVISSVAVYQFVTNSDRVWHVFKPYAMRASGTYISPNHLGGFLEMLLPLALAYTVIGRIKPVTRVALGYVALVILAGIAVTVSRGAWFSTALALLMFFVLLFFHRTYRLPSFVFLFLFLAAGGFFFPKTFTFQMGIKRLVRNGKIDDDLRFDLWRPTFKVWHENPWFGGGPNHFNYRFRKYRPEIIQLQPDRAHNDLLNTLADFGIVGVVLVLGTFILLAIGVLRTWRYVRAGPKDIGGKTTSNKYAVVIGASLGLCAILFHSMVDFNLHIPANALIAVTLMAILSSHLRFATDNYWIGLGTPLKTIATVLMLSGLTYLGTQGYRNANEQRWLARAQQYSHYSNSQIACLERAAKAEPKNEETALSIATAYQIQSSEGGENYRDLAQKAIEWFNRAMALNPIDAKPNLGLGYCFDWTSNYEKAQEYFDKGETLDPNNYYNLTLIGRHYVEIHDYAAARPYFERSARLQWKANQTADNYLEISTRKMLETATNNSILRLDAAGK